MKAVTYFLENTGLRKCPRRDRLVQSIRNHSRPMAQAKRLVKKKPKPIKYVCWEEFNIDIVKFWLRRGHYDPVFHSMVSEGRKAAKNGTWTKSEHEKLMSILNDSWVPWAKEDIAEQKERAQEYWEYMQTDYKIFKKKKKKK